MKQMVGFVTDLEGNGKRWEHYIARGNVIERTSGGLAVRPGYHFVFGGDALDRGPQGLRILRELVALKKRQPEQVTLLLGNRDINKMKLRDNRAHIREILLKLNSSRAFEFRKEEIRGSDEETLDSFLADLEPGGALYEYWQHGELAKVIDSTIYTHGQIRTESVGTLPFRSARVEDIRSWANELNHWAQAEIRDWSARKGGQALIAYQHPDPATPGRNDRSVIYGRLRDASGNTVLPPIPLLDRFREQGIFRAVSGHTPQGDTPVMLREPTTHDFELVIGDHSYSESDYSSDILIRGNALQIEALLPNDRKLKLDTEIGAPSIYGKRLPDGFLVVGPLDTGEAHLVRIRPDFKPECRSVPHDRLFTL